MDRRAFLKGTLTLSVAPLAGLLPAWEEATFSVDCGGWLMSEYAILRGHDPRSGLGIPIFSAKILQPSFTRGHLRQVTLDYARDGVEGLLYTITDLGRERVTWLGKDRPGTRVISVANPSIPPTHLYKADLRWYDDVVKTYDKISRG